MTAFSKKAAEILIVSLLFLAPAGCRNTVPQKSAVPGNSAASSSRSQAGSAVSSAAGLKKGEAVSIGGESSRSRLHGVDFLDANTGWMIRDRYNTGGSELLSTRDGGENWTKVGTGSFTLDAVRFTDPSQGWAVAQETVKTAKVPEGSPEPVQYSLLHTADGGKNWSLQWKNGSAGTDESPALWAGDPRNAFALAGGSLLKTADGGKSWTKVPFGVKNFHPVKMAFTDAKTGWAAGVSAKGDVLSVLHTADGGGTWSLQFRKKYDGGGAGCLGVDFLNGKEGWFLTSGRDTGTSDLYHTVNGGSVWKRAGTMRGIRPYAEGLCFLDSRTGWIPFDCGAGPLDGGLACSRDGGKTFHFFGETSGNDAETRKIRNAGEIVFRTAKLGWAVGHKLDYGSYLLRTQDGGSTWKQVYPKPGPIVDISFVNNGTGYGMGKLSDPNALLKTEDGGRSWRTVRSFAGKYIVKNLSFISEAEGWVLAVPVSSVDGTAAVLKTEDGGKAWQKAGNIGQCRWGAVYFRFFDTKNGVAAGDSAEKPVCRTADGGKTWTLLSAEPPENAAGQYEFLSASSGRQVCSPGRGGKPYRLELSRLSPDGGLWGAPALAADNAACRALAFFSEEKGFLLAEESPGTDGRMELLTTQDGGKTWDAHLFPEDVSGGGLNNICSQFPMQFTDDLYGWILTGSGLLATRDGGKTWIWQ